MQNYYSNGKLLLTGEYLVLDEAISLAIPTKYGQTLNVKPIEEPCIYWKSLDENNAVWFEGKFEIDNDGTLKLSEQDDISKRLFQILQAAKKMNPEFLNSKKGYKVRTTLDFPKNWGLGTSSTLISNIAQWAKIDAYKLLESTFGGSGYDIACALNNTPITYQLESKHPFVKTIDFNPVFTNHLYFIHLNQKQNSREGIAHYRAQDKTQINEVISEINSITSKIISCKSLEDFKTLIDKHESIISKITNQQTVKDNLFQDFNGSIKSLGAWGGDFILVASKENPIPYFKNKGYGTIIPYSNMVL